MRFFYTFLLVVALSFTASAEAYRGFLLTKDNYQLTGYFNLIEYSPTGNYITFTNDFGDVYAIHPMLVKGFGFNQDGSSVRFASRYHEGQWFFLRQVEAGRYLNLYSLPDGKDNYVDDSMLQLFTVRPPNYWLEFGRAQMLPVPRLGYKKVLKDFMAETNPSLARRIGKRGYRYKDIENIVAEYNVTSSRKRVRL